MSLTDKQLRIRRKGITSTDMAAILGLSPWRSALDVWRDKRGQLPPLADNEHLRRGRYFEEPMRQWYRDATGCERVDLPGTVISKRNPLVIATPDGVPVFGPERRALECKVPVQLSDEWGAPGTDEVPEHYHVQGHWHLTALDLERCDFAVYDGRKGGLLIYTLYRDAELEAELVERAERFWTDHVEANRPPPVTSRDDQWLRSTYPRDNGVVIRATELEAEVQAVLPQLFELHGLKGQAEKRFKDLVATVQRAMGEASELESELGTITWKTNASGGTDWKGLAEHLLEGRADAPSLLKKFLKPGARPFNVKGRK